MEFQIDSLDLSAIQTLDDLLYSVSNQTGFLIYVYDKTPQGKQNVCPPYKDNIPSEEDIINKFGGGDYEVLVKYREAGKPVNLIKSLSFKYEGARKNREVGTSGSGAVTAPAGQPEATTPAIVHQPVQQQNNSGLFGMDKSKMQEFMDLMTFIDLIRGKNSDGENAGSSFYDRMLDMQEKHNSSLMSLMKSDKGGSNDNSFLIEIAKEAISKKSNPLIELKELKETLDMFKGEAGEGENGDMFSGLINKVLPAIIEAGGQKSGDEKIVLSQEDIAVIADSIIQHDSFSDYIKGMIEEVLLDYRIITPAHQQARLEGKKPVQKQPLKREEAPKTGNQSNTGKDPVKGTETPLKSKSKTNIEKQTPKEVKTAMNPIQQAIMTTIKKSPKKKQDELLKEQMQKHGYKKSLEFCLAGGNKEYQLVKDEAEFKARCKSAGIDLSKVKE